MSKSKTQNSPEDSEEEKEVPLEATSHPPPESELTLTAEQGVIFAKKISEINPQLSRPDPVR